MRSKKIYIEGLALVEGHFSGIGQYILGILKGLDEVLDAEKLDGETGPTIQVVIPYDTVDKFHAFGFKHITHKSVPFSFRYMSALWHRGKMPPLDLFCGRGTYVFTRFVGMPLAFSKSYVVIYDLSYELFKQYSDDKNARFLSRGVRKSIDKAEGIITISESVKREIVDFYGFESSRVVVAYPATDQDNFYHRSDEEIERIKNKYSIKGEYILALSNLEPRKNLDGLVTAYSDLPKSITEKVSLLLVGVNGWKTDKLFEKIIDKVQNGYRIIRPSSYVTDRDKPALISGAKLLVYPSHYEGFGMPPLEALACGTPVITSSNSSLPEVVGDAGTMVDSSSVKNISAEMKKALENWSDTSRVTRIKGPMQARKFSWAKSARIILDNIGGS